MALEQPRSRPKDKTECVYAGCDYPRKACIGACKDDQNAAGWTKVPNGQVETPSASNLPPAAPSGTLSVWERCAARTLCSSTGA